MHTLVTILIEARHPICILVLEAAHQCCGLTFLKASSLSLPVFRTWSSNSSTPWQRVGLTYSYYHTLVDNFSRKWHSKRCDQQTKHKPCFGAFFISKTGWEQSISFIVYIHQQFSSVSSPPANWESYKKEWRTHKKTCMHPGIIPTLSHFKKHTTPKMKVELDCRGRVPFVDIISSSIWCTGGCGGGKLKMLRFVCYRCRRRCCCCRLSFWLLLATVTCVLGRDCFLSSSFSPPLTLCLNVWSLEYTSSDFN